MFNNKQYRNMNTIKKVLPRIILTLVILIAAFIAVISTVQLDKSNKETNYILSSGFSSIASTSKTSAKKKTKITAKSTTKKTTGTKAKKITTSKTTEYIRHVSYPIDINQADYDDLVQIKGIGQVMADKILSYRNSVGTISNIDMLLNIDGIGNATLQNLKKYLYVADYDYKDIETTVQSTETTIVLSSNSKSGKISSNSSRKSLEQTSQRRKVNINNSDAEEIADALLIDKDMADDIIELRNKIDYFSDFRELLYINGMTEELLCEIKDYIEI